MANNAQTILTDVLSQQQAERAPELSPQDYFEVFCVEQILKDYDLSYEEIQNGIVDGEHDGGIDAVYTFINGELVGEDFDGTSFKRDISIELHILQSKSANGFSEAEINKLISSTRHLLNLGTKYDALTQFNEEVKKQVDLFRKNYRKFAAKFPSLKIYFYYAAKNADDKIHPNLLTKVDELRAVAIEQFSDAQIDFTFLGARHLLDLGRRRPLTVHDLKIVKNLSDVGGYIVLCQLDEYANFLRAENGRIRGDIFEANVRDFQGTTEVNDEIANTILHESKADFWWMNNGVTILASRATLNGDIVAIENPQIVNGLQTSTQIAQNIPSNAKDARKVMVKIVSSEDEETRDKIIKATNSQNPIQAATLRATDKVQRDIEDSLKGAGYFYDRRKNFYKNQGKPAARIISIPLMAQSVMSIILGAPDTARARPSSLIKKDDVYSQVFSEKHPILLYVNAGALILLVDKALKSDPALTARDRSNLRFYVLNWLAAVETGKPTPNAQDVANLDLSKISDAKVASAVAEVLKRYVELGSSDQIAKGPDLRDRIRQDLKQSLTAQQGK